MVAFRSFYTNYYTNALGGFPVRQRRVQLHALPDSLVEVAYLQVKS